MAFSYRFFRTGFAFLIALGLFGCKGDPSDGGSGAQPPENASGGSETPITAPPPSVPTPPGLPPDPGGDAVEAPQLTNFPAGVVAHMSVNGSKSSEVKAGDLVRVKWYAMGLKDFRTYLSSSANSSCPLPIQFGQVRKPWRIQNQLQGETRFIAHPCHSGQTFRLVIEGVPNVPGLPDNLKVNWMLASISWSVSFASVGNDLTQIRITGGNGQMTNQHQGLPNQMVATVFDQNGLPWSGAEVSWKVLGAGLAGWLWPLSDSANQLESVSVADGEGHAQMSYKVGYVDPVVGILQMPIEAKIQANKNLPGVLFKHVLHLPADFAGRTFPSMMWLKPMDEDSPTIQVKANSVLPDALQFLFSSSHSRTSGRRLESVGLEVVSDTFDASDPFTEPFLQPTVECAEGIPLSDANGIVSCSLKVGKQTGEVRLLVKIAGLMEMRRLKIRVVP